MGISTRHQRTRRQGARLSAFNRALLSVLAVVAVLSTPASAQFFAFGQNKIQYRKLDWRIM
jgi:hypothetical protein